MSTMQRTRAPHAISGRIYWAVFTRHPGAPIVRGSHWGVRVDPANDANGGHVFSSERLAADFLASLPTHYDGNYPGSVGRAIDWELGRVLYTGQFYDVVATGADALAAGDTVNMAGADAAAPYWQVIDSIEHAGRVGGREGSGHGADVYRVRWQGAEPNAAPSLLSSRQVYDVVTLRY